jgi:mRNA interferase RelE/StbE
LAWTIKYAESAVRQLKKLDRSVAVKIVEYLDERVASSEDPRSVGKKLSGPRLGAYWRFRIGDVRVICDVQDLRLIVLVLELGHRKEVYR